MTAASPQFGQDVSFLEGLSVLELGDGIAGSAATSVLGSLGATVTTLVDLQSPHRYSLPRLHSAEPSEWPSLLSIALDSQKRILEWPLDGDRSLASLEEAIQQWYGDSEPGATVVICDRVTRSPMGLPQLGTASDYLMWMNAVTNGAWVTISAFGLSGPRKDDYASELTLSAVSGILSSARDAQSGTPMKLAGSQALLSAGQAAALAACHCLDISRGGTKAHADLSAQEAAIATGPALAIAQTLLDTPGLGGAGRYGGPANFYRCSDGLIRVSVMENHQWIGFVKAIGSPAWTDRFATSEARIKNSKEVDQLVGEWAREQTKTEAEKVLQAQGVPATAMYSPAELLTSPQFVYRRAFKTITAPDGTKLKTIGQPFTPVVSATQAEKATRRLRGLQVLEVGRVLAVPLAAAILGALGADVTKLEDVGRIDMYRRHPPFIGGEAGLNRGAYFASVNHSKANYAIDFDGGAEDIEQLLARSDVVLENLGRGRAGALGISAYTAPASDRMFLACSLSGFGYQGPFSGYHAYAPNIQTAGGLNYLTRNADGVPAEMDIAWADLISAYALATIVAAWAVGPKGNEPQGIDLSMAETVAARFNEFLSAASLDPDSDNSVDRANDVSPLAPNGVYRTADGWTAVSVTSDAEFRALRYALGPTPELEDDRFATAAGRFEARAEIDLSISKALSAVATKDTVARLHSQGVLCEALISPSELPHDPHLEARGFFVSVEHPEWGCRPLVGIPWRFEGETPLPLGSPPLLSVRDGGG